MFVKETEGLKVLQKVTLVKIWKLYKYGERNDENKYFWKMVRKPQISSTNFWAIY